MEKSLPNSTHNPPKLKTQKRRRRDHVARAVGCVPSCLFIIKVGILNQIYKVGLAPGCCWQVVATRLVATCHMMMRIPVVKKESVFFFLVDL